MTNYLKVALIIFATFGVASCSTNSVTKNFDTSERQIQFQQEFRTGDKITVHYKTGETQTFKVLEVKKDRFIGKIKIKTEGKANEYVITTIEAKYDNINKIEKHQQQRGILIVILGILAAIV